ncbi:LysM peptidoglycan-binding domain-containing protein [Endozoicomonas sp. Mp262]|uniref:lytic transglycosylase n=1 Tax=Endozoicomonas sp. Mp262 TaxID=2919499 RepID=UPI0021DB1E87
MPLLHRLFSPRQSQLPGAIALLLALTGCQSQHPVESVNNPITINKQGKPTSKNKKASNVSDEVETEARKVDAREQQETTVEITDLWQRIQEGLDLNLNQTNRRIQKELRLYKNNQHYFDLIATRASPYLYFIIQEVENRNMPLELALMPVVESAFDPFAYSHAGASGLWQIMPATGEHFGLKQNWWYDGRRDVVAATHMALDYMQSLYEMFGDWELALAAYNSGPGRVQNAVRKNTKKGKSTRFWYLDLPDETTSYVPKLIALGKIIQKPEKYGINLTHIPNQPFFVSVETGGQLDLAKAAKLAGIPIAELYKLNPGLNRWSTPPEGPHHLALPAKKAEFFKNRLTSLPMDKRVQWRRYNVKPGDSLNKIAKEYRTQVSLIKEINSLESTMIRINQPLLIPVPAKNAEEYSLTLGQRQKARQNRSVSGRQKYAYIVKPGDSFWTISRKYRVGVNELARWNNMAPKDPLRIHQKLAVWVKNANNNDKVVRKVSYKVRPGDSLSRIADKFNIGVGNIKDWNTLDAKYIQPGQQLTLYVDVTRAYD